MIDLCTLAQLKEWLGIHQGDANYNDEDDALSRLITAASLEFGNETRRPDFAPKNAYIDRLVGTGTCDLYLKHYPIVTVASVTINGTEQDESDGTTTGWFFDADMFSTTPENCQKITFIGSCWPSQCSTYSNVPNIVVHYDAGYDLNHIPVDVTQAVIELAGWKRGYSQLQSQNQSEVSWQQLGQYQQSVTAGASTLKASGVVMPDSVRQVIERYTRQSV